MKRTTAVLVATVWLGVLGVGMARLVQYEKTPTPTAAHPEHWPSNSALSRSNDGPTLLMFAHPRCPCTRASIAELTRLIDRHDAPAQIVFYQPADDASDAWTDSPLVRAARESVRLTVTFDPGGAESTRFGAAASGCCLLYDAAGRLAFAGGVTAGRGHEGPSRPQQLLADCLRSTPPQPIHCPTYGCHLD